MRLYWTTNLKKVPEPTCSGVLYATMKFGIPTFQQILDGHSRSYNWLYLSWDTTGPESQQ